MKRMLTALKAWRTPLLCGLFVILLFRYVLIIGYVPTASMEPAIQEGSYILGARVYSNLQRGDIVVFLHDGRKLVKRIAAVPGDVVFIKEQYMKVPAGHFFLLGDNAAESMDSRHWAHPFVPKHAILAKLLFH